MDIVLGRAGDVGGSRQVERSERTRAELLRAAEVIFARDGFEACRIEDIAAEAGRSRGAFYANFDSKTEVFLALRSLAVRRRAREIRERVEPIEGEEKRYAAVMRYLLEQICDTQTQLLQIEFKLFALRHGSMREELSEKHLETSTTINREELSALFPEKQKEDLTDARFHTLVIEALLEGVALNAAFSPDVMESGRLSVLVAKLLMEIFPPSEHRLK